MAREWFKPKHCKYSVKESLLMTIVNIDSIILITLGIVFAFFIGDTLNDMGYRLSAICSTCIGLLFVCLMVLIPIEIIGRGLEAHNG
jgi:fumarate reductase subunit D